MIRLILILGFVLFVIWLTKPYLKRNNRDDNQYSFEKLLRSDNRKFKNARILIFALFTLTLIVVFLWFLPKFGSSFFSLLQKFIPLISTLRGILPF